MSLASVAVSGGVGVADAALAVAVAVRLGQEAHSHAQQIGVLDAAQTESLSLADEQRPRDLGERPRHVGACRTR